MHRLGDPHGVSWAGGRRSLVHHDAPDYSSLRPLGSYLSISINIANCRISMAGFRHSWWWYQGNSLWDRPRRFSTVFGIRECMSSRNHIWDREFHYRFPEISCSSSIRDKAHSPELSPRGLLPLILGQAGLLYLPPSYTSNEANRIDTIYKIFIILFLYYFILKIRLDHIVSFSRDLPKSFEWFRFIFVSLFKQ
jgi:hypothetical protein